MSSQETFHCTKEFWEKYNSNIILKIKWTQCSEDFESLYACCGSDISNNVVKMQFILSTRFTLFLMPLYRDSFTVQKSSCNIIVLTQF